MIKHPKRSTTLDWPETLTDFPRSGCDLVLWTILSHRYILLMEPCEPFGTGCLHLTILNYIVQTKYELRIPH